MTRVRSKDAVFLGKARIYVNPDRQDSGEKWLWLYFEPDTGIDPHCVSLLYGNLDLDLDQYHIVEKSRLSGYDIRDKIRERQQRGYKLLAPLPCDNLEIVKTVIAAWQPILFREEPVVVDPHLVPLVKQGIAALGGNVELVHNRATPKPIVVTRVLVAPNPATSRYDW